MKATLIWITVLVILAVGCSPAAAPTSSTSQATQPPSLTFTQTVAPALTSTPLPTSAPSSTLEPPPTATIEPSATPKFITDPIDLIGLWHRTTPSMMVGDIWRVYKEDGTYVVASTREELETNPKVTGQYVFDGSDLVVTDLTGDPGWDECVNGGVIGRYRVVVDETGYIHFVKVEDACGSRSMTLPQGVYERIE